MSPNNPLVSVIIPTYNSSKYLVKCLTSLKRQTYRQLELIVVDDGSTDRTLEIAKSFDCTVVNTFGHGRAAAKNKGIIVSNGQFLFFIDSDMELTSNVIKDCVHLIQHNRLVAGIIVPELSIGDSFWSKVRDFERSFYAESPIESARFFSSTIVKSVGGFEENLVFYEESTLPFKIQKRGHNVKARITSVILHHEDNFSLSFWLKKKFLYGKTFNSYRSMYPEYSNVQTNVVFRSALFLKRRKKFFSNPKMALGVLILKNLEFLALFFGELSSFNS